VKKGDIRQMLNSKIKNQTAIQINKSYPPILDVNALKAEYSQSTGFFYLDHMPEDEVLMLAEDKFLKIFNISPIIMTITSMKEGRFINANDSFYSSIGFSQEEAIGRTSLEIGFWIYPYEREQIISRLCKGEVVNDQEIHFCMKTGEQRLGMFSAAAVDIEGEQCILGILTDITERRKMEAEFIRFDRLKLAGEMAVSIGHEIRNPLTAVRGFLQIFEGKYSEDKDILHLMIEEIDKANAIITELLALSKNKLVLRKPVNLNSTLTSILPVLQASARMQQKQVIVQAEQVPDMLMDDKELYQLILNLVLNGLDSMAAGGVVTIKTRLEDEGIIISVQDQGSGIAPEIMEKLGTPFFSTKDQRPGLGLAICYGIADRHKARIDIKTGAKGTIVSVRFDMLPAAV